MIYIDLPTISRRHARIVIIDGATTLEDLGSKNGTWVGKERVTGSVERSPTATSFAWVPFDLHFASPSRLRQRRRSMSLPVGAGTRRPLRARIGR